jgi:hypothetical protein
MRNALIAAICGMAVSAAVFVSVLVFTRTEVDDGSVEIQPLTSFAPRAQATRSLPPSWVAGLEMSGEGELLLLSCLDVDGDRVLTSADRAEFGDLEIMLGEVPCARQGRSADFYAGSPSNERLYSCDADPPPVLIVSIGSAGSDLLDPSAGESMGVLQIVNALQAQVEQAGFASLPILTVSAVFGADPPQRSLELLLAREVSRRLDEMACLRAVIIGHSHGGATVTAVTAALDSNYSRRVFGVLIDRTTALYDRNETEYPDRTLLLNVFQMNEGWHGVPLNRPNVFDIDQSYERAPIAPSDGGGGIASVTHKTLDDALGVQRIITDAVMLWLAEP